MQRLIAIKDRFDIGFACDTDHDRHGIVTPAAGLLPPNHFLAVAVDYLFRHRPQWSASAAVGKTVVSTQGDEVDLGLWATKVKPLCKSKKAYRKLLQDQVDELSDQQRLLYASNRHVLLLVFQAMDTAGKDGAICHVMSGVNPQGCQVFSFQHPSAQELQHDFLWRTTRDLPERGRIGIFNRSYYEEVLIVRVHSNLLHSEGTLFPSDLPTDRRASQR